MATKEWHAPRAGQAPAWPGPAKDPAWVGLAPEPAQAGPAHEPAWGSRALSPAQAGRAREQDRGNRAPEPARGSRTPGPAQAGRARQQDRGSRAPGPALAGWARGPAWRALLEAQWRARVQQVTELSLAFHEAASAAAAPVGAVAAGAARGPGERKVRKLLRRTVAARRALADTEDALSRLASGRYGLCEGCTAAIPARLLAVVPDARYCQRCRRRPAMAARPALRGG